MKYLFKYLFIFLFTLTISGCSYFTKKPDANALCVSECPAEFAPLRDDTFGSTTTKLKEVLDTYFNCRAACQVKK